jgi:pimeloyl-ACP methyl ester carboxylesterase
MERGYVGEPGAQVHYRTAGSGPPLVLLAPTPRSSNYYLTLIPHLLDYQVVAIDTPGFGLSDPLPRDWTMEAIADRVAAALRELGLGPMHVLGVHSGNKIGAALCAAHPGQVERFLFAGMTHSLILDNETRNLSMRAFYPVGRDVPDRREQVGTPDRLGYRWAYVRRSFNAIWDSYDPSADDGGSVRRESLLAAAVDQILGFDGYDRLYLANFSFDLEGTLRRMPVETVVIEMVVPDEDHLARQAEVLVRAIPRARAITLAGSDGRLVKADAAAFADAIRTATMMEFPSAASGDHGP